MSYSYRPLNPARNEIRILRLLPPTPHTAEPLRCEIAHISLDDITPTEKTTAFSALSYTWGSPNPILDKELQIVDRESCRAIAITATLDQALRAISQHHQWAGGLEVIAWIWVDAICINQADSVEKSWQVSMMKRVYEAAEGVLVWLGADDPNDDDSGDAGPKTGTTGMALRALEDLGKTPFAEGVHLRMAYRCYDAAKWRRLIVERRLIDIEDGPQEKALVRLVEAMSASACMSDRNHELRAETVISLLELGGVRALCENPWWRRVWVIQEFVSCSAASFVCGATRVDAEAVGLSLALMCLLSEGITSVRVELGEKDHDILKLLPLSIHRPQPMFVLRWSHRHRRSPMTLHDLLDVVVKNGWRATDPRDVIFSLLGMASDAGSLDISLDYAKDVTAVYAEVTVALMRAGFCDVLKLCTTPKEISGLPSWVPDFSAKGHAKVFCYSGIQPAKGTDLCIEGAMMPACGGSGAKLCLRGYLLSEVGAICPPCPATTAVDSNFEEVFHWYQFRVQPLVWVAGFVGKAYTSEQECQDAIFNALTTGLRLPALGIPADWRPNQEVIVQVWCGKADSVQFMQKYLVSVVSINFGNPVFVTEGGHLGSARGDIKIGDQLVVFAGIPAVFVLRENSDGHHEVVGEAYVHGAMFGEYIDTGPTARSFTLV